MRIKIGTRQTGRTTWAAALAQTTGAYLVVRSQRTAERVAKEFPGIRFPMTYDELLRDKLHGSSVQNIVIDDADGFLQYVVESLRIEGITLLGKEYQNDQS
jgi:hypothetical protein